MTLNIDASTVLQDVHLGDSISINGVCLTVTQFTSSSFAADVMPETFHSTTLRTLKNGDPVNLERAMAAGGRFGGHFVSGHVDGVGTIVSKRREQNAIYVHIEIPEELLTTVIYKGSIAIDGTSLTVFGVEGKTVTVSLIPHTSDQTILAKKSVGESVNIETDLLAKYVQRIPRQHDQQSGGITMDTLHRSGFMEG